MPIEPGDGERARELARRSSQVRRRRLVLEEVERELPLLTDLESAMHRLDVVARWSLAGMVAGTVLNGVVRSCEVWLKLHEFEIDRDRIKTLERRIAELEAERSDWRLP